ncbi:MAG: nuclear transport factor 2 family protein [Parvibaculaceae bacterium]|nr:nuclear transport factor 2 family protein [Parvibaculaceae bacterium]
MTATMMTKENPVSNLAQHAEEFYTLLLSDFAAAERKYISDDFEWVNPLPEIVPFGGTYKGVPELMRYLGELNAAIEMKPLHITQFVADGLTIAAIGVEQDTIVKKTGKRYTMPFVHVLHFNADGKINCVREYNDTTQMLEAFAD